MIVPASLSEDDKNREKNVRVWKRTNDCELATRRVLNRREVKP